MKTTSIRVSSLCSTPITVIGVVITSLNLRLISPECSKKQSICHDDRSIQPIEKEAFKELGETDDGAYRLQNERKGMRDDFKMNAGGSDPIFLPSPPERDGIHAKHPAGLFDRPGSGQNTPNVHLFNDFQ